MKMLTYIYIDLKIMFRIPLAIFFTLIFPILMMVIMMTAYGNIDFGNGYHFIDKYFMIAIGMGILPLTLVSFPIWIGESLENTSFLRLHYFNVKTSRLLIGDVLAHFILGCGSIIINILIAKLLYNLHLPTFSFFLSFFTQYALALIVFMLIGTFLALLLFNPQIIMPFGLLIMFVFYMFCGAFIPFDQMPATIKNIADFIPIKYAMNDFYNIWMGANTLDVRFLQLSIIYIVILLFILPFIIKKRLRMKKGDYYEK